MVSDRELDEFFEAAIDAPLSDIELLDYLSGDGDEFVRSRMDAHFRHHVEAIRRLNALERALAQPIAPTQVPPPQAEEEVVRLSDR